MRKIITSAIFTALVSVLSLSAQNTAPELVDLGLSVKWAACNLGADAAEEPGGYYQWAGTENVLDPSNYLNWRHCPYHVGRNNNPLIWKKYTISKKHVLAPEDDAAHVILGGKWRMPTDAEWEELRTNCAWVWNNLNGVNGYLIISKVPGYTDKTLFLPAAGCRIYDNLSNVGIEGHYWSSSLDINDETCAYGLSFHKDYFYGCRLRFYGMSVRPVYGEPAVTEETKTTNDTAEIEATVEAIIGTWCLSTDVGVPSRVFIFDANGFVQIYKETSNINLFHESPGVEIPGMTNLYYCPRENKTMSYRIEDGKVCIGNWKLTMTKKGLLKFSNSGTSLRKFEDTVFPDILPKASHPQPYWEPKDEHAYSFGSF